MNSVPSCDPSAALPDAGASPRIRLRAAAVLVRDDGAVLLHRREGDTFWALPGGKVEPGESAAEALVREFREELAVEIKVGPLVCLAENFFVHQGAALHEVGLYFMAEACSAASYRWREPGPYAGVESGTRLEFAWFTPQARAQLDMRPAFLGEWLSGPMPSFRHIVHRG